MSRRRWVYVDGEAVEVSSDYTPPPRTVADSILWNDRQYQDSGDPRFSSRSQYQEFCRRTGLTNTSDFKEEWRKAEAKRMSIRVGEDSSRKEDVERAISQLNSRR